MPNPLLALPLYFALTFLPHLYSITLLRRLDPRLFNNANPAAASTHAAYRTALGPTAYARWERARAAHRNGLECFPLFAAALLGGHAAGVPGLGAVAALGVACRAVYNGLYILVEDKRKSYLRSAVYSVETLAGLGVLVRAGLKG